ncbi:MAG: phosphate acyltransferase PlsX, partial [Candidatus Margulisbacteria bacterium]|nr:phosphate acyltransferase PlsX [Candidatus Margulisiibacteriota bacterium]
MVRIAVDAMGGDHAPLEIVKGAVMAAELLPEAEIVLVGDSGKLKNLLSRHKACARISIESSDEVIGMDEPPVSAVREKKKASVNVALQLEKDKKVDAVVSAGNTGALMAASLFKLGRIPGIERPAIATLFPAITGKVLLLDMGANVDNKPKHLRQFGEMGSVYAEHLMHVRNPKVGLLNIGEEKEKGNELTRAAWELLKQAPINFIGNVESKEV